MKSKKPEKLSVAAWAVVMAGRKFKAEFSVFDTEREARMLLTDGERVVKVHIEEI